jgi:hypothetical protein
MAHRFVQDLKVEATTETLDFQYTVPSSDGEYNGEIALFGTDPLSATEGDIVYLSALGVWTPAQANSVNSTSMLGVWTGNEVILRGFVRYAGSGGGAKTVPASSIGKPMYLSAATAGAITSTVPGTGNYVRIVGHVISTTNDLWYFQPDNTWVKK